MKDQSKLVIIKSKEFHHTPGEVARSVFYYIQSTGFFCCGSGHKTIRTGMKSVLLVYTLSGTAFLTYRGKNYPIKPGDLFFINCKEHHVYGVKGENNWEFKYLHFYGNNCEKMHDTIYQIYGPVMQLGQNSPIEKSLDNLYALSSMKEVVKKIDARIMSLISNLLSEIFHCTASRLGEIKNHKPNKMVNRAIEFIENNYTSDLKLEDIASAAYASKYHFSRLFKKIVGSSPYAYLLNYRINMSKNKLKHTSKSISEIGVEVGFDSTSNFIKTFRMLEGMTPAMYRKV